MTADLTKKNQTLLHLSCSGRRFHEKSTGNIVWERDSKRIKEGGRVRDKQGKPKKKRLGAPSAPSYLSREWESRAENTGTEEEKTVECSWAAHSEVITSHFYYNQRDGGEREGLFHCFCFWDQIPAGNAWIHKKKLREAEKEWEREKAKGKWVRQMEGGKREKRLIKCQTSESCAGSKA